MVKGYAAGVNAYLRDVGGSKRITDPACKGARWVRPDATAKDIWYAVYAANLLASTGVFVPQIAGAAPSAADPGLPEAPVTARLRAATDRCPNARSSSPRSARTRTLLRLQRHRGRQGDDHHRPRDGARQPALPLARALPVHPVPPDHPGKYDVAGAGLIGSPVVNIGWNKDVAWSHTVSTAYRFTPYEYKTVPAPPSTSPRTARGARAPHRLGPVRAADGTVSTVQEDVYRTDEGYVLDAPDALMPWSPASFFALRDANAEHLRTVDTFHAMGKATGVRDLLRRQDRGGGMPWVNTTAADRRGNVLYADHSVVPNVPDDLVQECLTPTGVVFDQVAGLPALDGTRARSACAWRTDDGAQRPGVRAAQPAQHGPQGLGGQRQRQLLAAQPGPAARGVRRDHRLRAPGALAAPADGLPLRHRPARRQRRPGPQPTRQPPHPQALRAREPRLRCRARPGGRRPARRAGLPTGASCDVLAAWDGRSDIDSVGTQVFQEFWNALQDATVLWETPFDPAQPVTTPRNLADQSRGGPGDARRARLPRRAGIDPATPWGRLQVAGDEGAPPIAVGGGEGFAGNANAVASWAPASNTGRLYPISYGSSHIQASPSRTAAGSPRTRSSPTASRWTRPGAPRGPDPAVQPGAVGAVPVDRPAGPKRRCGPTWSAAADRTGGQRPGWSGLRPGRGWSSLSRPTRPRAGRAAAPAPGRGCGRPASGSRRPRRRSGTGSSA